MKQKKITIALAVCLVIIASASIVAYRFYQLRPTATKSGTSGTPIVIYETETVKNDSPRPTMTEEDKIQADAPGEKLPTIDIPPTVEPTPAPQQPTTNAPKQDEIRQTVTEELKYYPLVTANDPGYASNWALQKVNAPTAWNLSTGNGQTVVAVIDTGFALNHEDLKDNWYQNASEFGMTTIGSRCWTGYSQDKTTNNCDDDNNGYKDDWRGWNFSIRDNNVMTGRTNPSGAGVAHGTETSGLVGATGNNAAGIVTVNWNTKIMPLQALSDDGPGYTSDIAAAIYYAVDNGASVINMSFGGSSYDPALKTAIDYAFNNNVVVVAAAGNCGTGNEQGCQGQPAGSMGYPALNDHVISVGATTINDQRASFSSFGPGLDIVAPGSGTIVSPTWTATNGTTLYSGALYGTSFASPQVASLASLIKSIRPDSSVDDITALLLATTTKLPIMNGAPYTNQLGHGIMNANTALTVATSLNASTAAPQLLQAGGVTSEHTYTSSDTLGSGCATTSGAYCTVWLRNQQTGNDRYLPYQLASAQGLAGWSWSGSILPSGDWHIRAVQGDSRSSLYTLGNK